jgi:CSLREA domain-containing protein
VLVAGTLALHALVAAIASSPARAASYDVHNLADNTVADGACTLREAMLAANNTPANGDCGPGSAAVDEIFLAAPGTIALLGTALPAISQTLTIVGHAEGSTIDGNQWVRPFSINPSVAVTLEKLAIVGGSAPWGSPGYILPSGAGEDGGAIHNRGSLSLRDVRISGSVAGRGGSGSPDGAGGRGGAIYNAGSFTGFRVTFDGNSSGAGGGCCGRSGAGGAIYNEAGVPMTRSSSGGKAPRSAAMARS